MVDAFKMMEEKMYDNNIHCVSTVKPLLLPVAESLEGLKSAEEEGMPPPFAPLTLIHSRCKCLI